MELLQLFKRRLLENKGNSSSSTVKNYLSDVRHFISWCENITKRPFDVLQISGDTLLLYEKTMGGTILTNGIESASQLSVASVKRHLSSLRKFFTILEEENVIVKNPFTSIVPETNVEPTDYWHLKSFKDFLLLSNASKITIKNYLSDVQGFAKWYEEAILPETEMPLSSTQGFYLITQNILEDYRKRLIEIQNAAPRTINRKLSSLRRYLDFATKKGFITTEELTLNPVKLITAVTARETPTLQLSELSPEKIDPKRTYSKIPPLRLAQKLLIFPYLSLEETSANLIAGLLVGKAINGVQHLPKRLQKELADKNILRAQNQTISGLLGVKNVEKEFYAPDRMSLLGQPLYKRLIHHTRFTRPQWYKKYHNYTFVHYVHFALLVIFASGVGVSLYQNLIVKKQTPTFAAATAPPRILSFQGRLTDNQDNPITSSTNIRFAIYNDSVASGSALLWQEVNTVTPDQDGIFSILLGGGTAIDTATVFGSNANIYLGATVQSTPELTPRQRIATVGYASNSEFLQGQPPTTQAGLTSYKNVILALDSSGNLILADSSPTDHTFQTLNGAFILKGLTTQLTTNSSSNGNVILSPDGLGKIDLQKPLVNTTTTGNLVPGGVEVNDKFGILATESAVAAFIVNNNTTGGDILAASSSGTTRFKIGNDGTITSGIYTGQNGVLYGTQTTGVLAQTTTPTAGQCLQSGVSNPTWGTCGAASYWNLANGALSPIIDNLDLLIGGQATASAKFRFINTLTGTPVASISANNGNNALFASGDGSIGTTNRQTLTIGNSSSYNTTGNILFNPNGVGSIGINTTNPLASFDLQANSITGGTTPVASISSNTSFAALLVDNTGVGDLITASHSGATYFSVNTKSGVFGGNPYDGEVSIGKNGNGKLTVAVVDPIIVANQKTSGTQSLTFQTLGASNADFIFKNTSTTLSTLTQAGQLQLPIAGSTGGLVLGGDTQIFRGAADRIDVASGDSINLISGSLLRNGSTLIDSSGNATFTNVNVTGTCTGCVSTGNSPFQVSQGAIVPGNTSLDFLVGAQATNSAKFAVLNINGSSTPIASVSAQNVLGQALILGGDGSIQSTRNNTLALGGNTTGNISLNPSGGTGNVYVGGNDVSFARGGANQLTVNNSLQIKNIGSSGYSIFNGDGTSNQFYSATSGTIFNIANGPSLTQAGAYTGANIDLSAGITVPNSANGNQTGLAISVKDGGASAVATALLISGTADTGIDLTGLGTVGTAAININATGGNGTAITASANAGGQAAFILNKTGIGDIFTASSSGTTKFTILNDGTASSSAGFTINGTGNIQSTNNQTLTIGGSSTGNIVISPTAGSGKIQLTNLTTNGGLLYTNASGILAQTGTGTATQCLLGGAGTPTFGSCSTGTNVSPLQELQGAIVPNNLTEDFLIGAQATNSAKFAVLNVSSGTPTASVSSGLNGNGASLDANGNLTTANRMQLTLGGGNTGNITIQGNGILTLADATVNLTGVSPTIGAAGSNTLTLNGNSTGNIQFFSSSNTVTNAGLATFASAVAAGTNPAASGPLRIPNNAFLTARNAANSGDVNLIRADASNLVSFGANLAALTLGGTITANAQNITGAGAITATSLALGTNPAAAGTLRLPNNTFITARNAANSADVNLISINGSNLVAFGANTAAFTLGGSITGNSQSITALSGITVNAGGTIDTAASGTLNIGSNANTTTVSLGRSGGAINLPGFTGQNGVLYGTSGTGVLAQATTASTGQCLMSGASNPAWGTCVNNTNSPFQVVSGTIVPNNTTEDFLIGAQATNSAKFAVLNVSSGTPTASVSSGLNGNGASLDANGNLTTANRMQLTLGGGNTGNISIQGNSILTLMDTTVNLGGASPKLGATGSNTLTINGNSTGNIQFFSSSNTVTNAGLATFASAVAAGTNPAASGPLRIPNNAFLTARNAANSGDVNLIRADASNLVSFGANLATFTLGGSITGNSNSITGLSGITINAGGTIDTAASGTLNMGGNANTTTIALGRSGGAINLPGFTGQNGVLYGTSGTGVLAQATTASTGQCLMSGASNPAWGACSSGGGGFDVLGTGVTVQKNQTTDFLLGSSATSSAKFAVLNLNGSGPATASVSGNLIVMPNNGAGGNVGIGTTSPFAKLHIFDAVNDTNVNIETQGINKAANLNLYGTNSTFGQISNYASNVKQWTLGNNGDIPAGGFGIYTTSSNANRLVVLSGGSVGIGTAQSPTGISPLAMLQVFSTLGTSPGASISAKTANTALLVTNDGVGDLISASSGGKTYFRLSTTTGTSLGVDFNGELDLGVDGVGKLNLGVSDPPYTIDGIKYATYAPSTFGLTEEYSGKAVVSYDQSLKAYAYKLNFNDFDLHSDLWVFNRIIDPDISTIKVFTSANSQAKTWYKTDGNNRTIVLYSDRPTEISYRLTALRFNHADYPTLRSHGPIGYNPPPPPTTGSNQNDNNINSDPYFDTLTINQQSGKWILKDSNDNAINQIDAFSKAFIANIEAGFAHIRSLAVDSISAGSSSLGNASAQTLSVASNSITIGGQDLRDIISQTVQTILNSQFSILNSDHLISPLAEVGKIKTNVISPLADNTAPSLQFGNSQISILNSTGTVSWFDNSGNASFSGQLTAGNIQTTNISAGNLVSTDATVSGTLHAGNIIADNITGLDEKLATLAAQLEAGSQKLEVSNQATPSSSQTPNSSLLATDTVHANFGIFEQGITSMGPITSNIVTATDSLAVGSDFSITNNAINTIGNDLQIQSLRQGNIAFEGGLIKMDTDGNMSVNGNFNLLGEIDAVHGVFSGTLTAPALATSLISPLPGDDLTIRLSDSASTSGRLKITDSTNHEVLSINSRGDIHASGSATLSKLNFNLVGQAEATSLTEAVATGSAGFATLRQGQVELTIKNPTVTTKSLIYITPFGNTDNKVLYLLRQVPQTDVDDGSFTVGISGQTATHDTQFNWLIVN